MCKHGKPCVTEHEAYINHLMSCGCCYAPNHQYCGIGRNLKLQVDARFVADLGTLEERRHWMKTLRREYGDRAPILEMAVQDLFAERKLQGVA